MAAGDARGARRPVGLGRAGRVYESLARHREAAACYDACVALDARLPWLYFRRGVAHLNADNNADARADFDHFLTHHPEVAEGYVNRALALEALGKHAEALADADAAVERGVSQTRVYFIRSRLRAGSGDVKGAKADRETGLRLEPHDKLSFVVRGSARLPGDPKGAGRLRRRPSPEPAARCTRCRTRPASSRSTCAGRRTPSRCWAASSNCTRTSSRHRPGAGVLLARQGKRAAALRDAQECLKRDRQAATAYQVAGIYALTSKQQPGDSAKALFLLTYSLRNGYGNELVPTDSDLDPIRKLPEFRRLTGKAKGP